MIHIIASLALFAIRPALTAIQDQSMPTPSPEEQARIDEWNSYLAGERSSPPPFEGTRWSPPLRRDTIVRVLLGGRFADEDIAPLEELYTAAIEAGVHTGEPGLSIDLGFAYSRDDDDLIISGVSTELTGEAFEVYAGPRWSTTFGTSTAVYLGLGGSLTRAEGEFAFQASDLSQDENLFGVYARAGAEWIVGPSTRVGLDVRHVFSEDSTFGGSEELQFDSTVVALVLGIGW